MVLYTLKHNYRLRASARFSFRLNRRPDWSNFGVHEHKLSLMLLTCCLWPCDKKQVESVHHMLHECHVLNFPIVPHHVVEVDVLVDDGAVAHVVVFELSLGDALALPVAVHCVAVRSAVSKVVDERSQHLPSRPVAVCELGMFGVVVRRLYTVVTGNTSCRLNWK